MGLLSGLLGIGGGGNNSARTDNKMEDNSINMADHAQYTGGDRTESTVIDASDRSVTQIDAADRSQTTIDGRVWYDASDNSDHSVHYTLDAELASKSLETIADISRRAVENAGKSITVTPSDNAMQAAVSGGGGASGGIASAVAKPGNLALIVGGLALAAFLLSRNSKK